MFFLFFRSTLHGTLSVIDTLLWALKVYLVWSASDTVALFKNVPLCVGRFCLCFRVTCWKWRACCVSPATGSQRETEMMTDVSRRRRIHWHKQTADRHDPIYHRARLAARGSALQRKLSYLGTSVKIQLFLKKKFLMKTENMSPVGFNSTLCKLKLCEKESSIVSFWNQYAAQIGFWFWFYNPLSLTVHTDRHLYARILCFFFLFFGLRSGGRASNLTKSPLRVDRFSDPWPWNLLTSHYPFITKTKQPRLDRMHRRSLRG